jgi:hypothetical protein
MSFEAMKAGQEAGGTSAFVGHVGREAAYVTIDDALAITSRSPRCEQRDLPKPWRRA